MSKFVSVYSFCWKLILAQPWAFFFIFIFSFGWAFDSVFWPYLLQVVVDTLTQFDANRGSVWTVLRAPIALGTVMWLLIEFTFRAQGFLMAKAIPKLESTIRMKLFDHIQQHSPRYFNDHFAGTLANQITDATTQVSNLFQQLLTLFIPTFAGCILAILFLFAVNPLFALFLSVLIIAHFAVCLAFTPKIDSCEEIHEQARNKLLGKIVDSFTNNFTVNLFYRFAFEKARMEQFQREEENKNSSAKNAIELMRLLLGLLTFLIGGVAIYSSLFYLWMQGKITTGEVVQIVYTSSNVCVILWIASTSIPALFQSWSIAKQALSCLQDPPDVADTPTAKPLVIKEGEIVFEKVTFHHGKRKLFQNKDVYIRGGENVGLVGYSGAGKTTFVNLILRFFPLEMGRILIDGQDISTVTLASLRSQVALIPQEPILFHRSLRDNILFGKPDATEKEFLEAVKMAHCHEFVSKLPQGYDTEVGERGTKLSGGERQRIAIARAIIAGTPIIILDEATSALDSVTEKYIQEGLENIMARRTTIVIAHRLSTLSKMDRILVFDEGRIVEEGSHTVLLALAGRYARMWQMQAGGFLPETLDRAEKRRAIPKIPTAEYRQP